MAQLKPHQFDQPAMPGSPPTGTRPRLARLVRFLGSAEGVVNVEMALIAIFLASLAIGAFDFGRFGIEKSRITSAARAGAQFGIQDQSTAEDEDGIRQAAQNDASDNTLTVASRRFCSCPNQGEVGCGENCADDGALAPMYVEVAVDGDVELMFTYPGIPDPVPISSTSTMRLR